MAESVGVRIQRADEHVQNMRRAGMRAGDYVTRRDLSESEKIPRRYYPTIY